MKKEDKDQERAADKIDQQNPSNPSKKQLTQFNKLADLTAGELLPELKPYVQYVSPEQPQVLKHPLVVQPFILPEVANSTYRHKIQMLGKATNIETIIFIHERPYRFDRLLTWVEEESPQPKDIAPVLIQVWTDAESVPPDLQKVILELFRSIGFSADRNQQKPTGPTTVYRGGHRRGISWTTCPDTAAWFANRWQSGSRLPQPLYQAIAPRTGVFAMLDARNEHEVIVDPAKLRNVRKIPPTP